jgi:hypothetical protein
MSLRRINMFGKEMDEGEMESALSTIYQKSLDGIPKIKSIPAADLAKDYLEKNKNSPEQASKALIHNQILKCGTSGFLTGCGGLITLPVTIPANIGSVFYIQLRMIAAIAIIGGFDPKSDQVQTLAYLCLTGSSINEIVTKTGVVIGEKVALSTVKKVPGAVLIKINKAVGFRLVTKMGTKGAVNLIKLVPVVGGIVGGTMDVVATKAIAANAYNTFIKNEIGAAPDYSKVCPEG